MNILTFELKIQNIISIWDTILLWFYSSLFSQMFQAVVPLTDLLAQLDELHLCWHVSHGPHTLPQVFVTDVAFLVPVKLYKRLTELWWKHTHRGTRVNVFNSTFMHMWCKDAETTSPSISSGLSSLSCWRKQRHTLASLFTKCKNPHKTPRLEIFREVVRHIADIETQF